MLAAVVVLAAMSAAAAPPPVTISQASVLSSPYTVELAPDGELRVLSFCEAFVSSVVLAKTWLVTALIQGRDVVLQAKATSGDTQAIVYADGVGTLWNIVIAPHKPVASRIVVCGSAPEPATLAAQPRGPISARPNGPPSSRVPAKLQAFAATLTAEQRAAFDAWQRDPTMERLSAFLTMLNTTQRAEFERLTAAGDVAIPQALSAPPLTQTTTVLAPLGESRSSAVAAPPGAAVGAAVPPAPAAMSPLYAYPMDVPAGIGVTVTPQRSGDSLVLQYTIHNGLAVWLQSGQVTLTNGRGARLTATAEGPRDVAPGADARGTLTIPASALPVTLAWSWMKAATQRIPLIGIERRVAQDPVRFYVLIAP